MEDRLLRWEWLKHLPAGSRTGHHGRVHLMLEILVISVMWRTRSIWSMIDRPACRGCLPEPDQRLTAKVVNCRELVIVGSGHGKTI